MEFVMRPIGEIHTPFLDKRDTPIQPSRSTARGQVEVYPAYVAGLRDLDGFSHIILLYVFHRSDDYTLRVMPFLDDRERGGTPREVKGPNEDTPRVLVSSVVSEFLACVASTSAV